jgi:hypothetical protein
MKACFPVRLTSIRFVLSLQSSSVHSDGSTETCRQTCWPGRPLAGESIWFLPLQSDVRPKLMVFTQATRDRPRAASHGFRRSRKPWPTQRISLRNGLWARCLHGWTHQSSYTSHRRWSSYLLCTSRIECPFANFAPLEFWKRGTY